MVDVEKSYRQWSAQMSSIPFDDFMAAARPRATRNLHAAGLSQPRIDEIWRRVHTPTVYFEDFFDGILCTFGQNRPSFSSLRGPLISMAGFWRAYGESRSIYTFTDESISALGDAKWPGNVGFDLLYLPVNGCVLRMSGKTFGVYYDTLETEIALVFVEIIEPVVRPDIPFGLLTGRPIGRLLEKGTLNESLAEVNAWSRQRISEIGGSWDPAAELPSTPLRAIVNALLYINHNYEDVKASTVSKRKSAKKRAVQKAQRFEVGAILAKKQRAYRQAVAEYESRGGSTRPHMRSAHPHWYRVGPGRRALKLKFLAPIQVGGRVEYATDTEV